jgi:hypothetical protein
MAASKDQAGSQESSQQLVEEAIRLLGQHDSYQAVELIESHEAPLEAIRVYHGMARTLYSRKQVPEMLMIGRAGVQFGLARARNEADLERILELKGAAKALAYDVASNAWPGWNDEGIALTASDLASGRDLARLNLRLAVELKRDSLPQGNAHWLLGAHELAAGKGEQAIACFEQAAAQFQKAGKTEYRLMAEGYRGIARIAGRASAEAGRRELAEAVDALRQLESDDARFFAEQLRSVAKMFASEP